LVQTIFSSLPLNLALLRLWQNKHYFSVLKTCASLNKMNLGLIFQLYKWLCACRLWSEAKQPSLKLKTWHKQFLGSLPLNLALLSLWQNKHYFSELKPCAKLNRMNPGLIFQHYIWLRECSVLTLIWSKQPSLKLKTWPKQFLGSLPLNLALLSLWQNKHYFSELKPCAKLNRMKPGLIFQVYKSLCVCSVLTLIWSKIV
jgi:hypothetical protein